MKKLDSLKQHLLDTVPKLKQNPEGLHLFADSGYTRFHATDNLHFSYHFQCIVLIENMSIDPDDLFVPLIWWVRHNQTDIADDDIKFIIDPLDGNSYDIKIEFPLDERVLVTTTDKGFSTKHPPEPVPEYNLPRPPSLNSIEIK